MNFAERALEIKDYIVEARRHFHKYPELSYKEWETTKYLIEKLTEMGIPVQSFEDYPGCIATIKGGCEGKTVLLRADIDALPITENSGVEFQSVNEGLMHACGHDCHTSMLLGAAKLLNEKKDELKGTVKLLFQSGEEAFYGSHYYWDKGYLNGIDAAAGMHVWPTVQSGHMAIQDGYLMAACDNFVLTFKGKSSHGSRPDEGHDAIVAAASFLVNLQTVVSRLNNPLSPMVVTIGSMKAGTQFNIIAGEAVLEGTVRTYEAISRDMAEAAIRRVADSCAAMQGCTAVLDYDYIEPSVNNDDHALNEIARESAVTLWGEDVLEITPKATGSEDFSYLMEKIPSSLFMFLGCYDEASGSIYPVHNEKFRVNEDILPIGAAEYAQFAADYLEKGGTEA